MRNILYVLILLLLPIVVNAAPVEVFTVMEETMSPMELRALALNEGFAKAVTTEAQTMLGGGLAEDRAEFMRQYFVEHAKPYIQGYKVLSSRSFEDGLEMKLDVRINRRTLRDGLKAMGLFETVKAPQPASVSWPEDMTEEEIATLQGLMVLTGLEQRGGDAPAFTLEYGPEQTYKGRLVTADNEWSGAAKDMSVVWFRLWTRYFSREKADASPVVAQFLTISGWFTPDGVLEFDRVLKGWDSAVQDTRLVEMDIQPTGVSATWDMHVLDRSRLGMLLNSFLPQRGLSFQYSRGEEK